MSNKQCVCVEGRRVSGERVSEKERLREGKIERRKERARDTFARRRVRGSPDTTATPARVPDGGGQTDAHPADLRVAGAAHPEMNAAIR